MTADVVVYGGNSAAVIAAVRAAELGHSVIMVSPDRHLGGLTSGGLGWTDTGNKAVIGGLAREFYHRIFQKYQDDGNWAWQTKEQYGNRGQGTRAIDGEQRTMWIFEPHIAEEVYEDMIAEHDIKIMREEYLDRSQALTLDGRKIKQFTTLSGKVISGSIYIDATYEGDLMALAGVDYHVGRESNEVYGENWNGVQKFVFQHRHFFKEPVDPYVVPGDPTSGLLPKISADPPGENGTGDERIQAYCFRMCLSDHPDNQVPFSMPEGYNRDDYALMGRVFASGWTELFDKFDPMPNRKTDTNNHGPFSTDNIGMNYDYPEATYERRRAIIEEHEDYQKGLMYFLATDKSVPTDLQKEFNRWGLAKDEFLDNEHWPHQIYVREARRMIGEYVMTEHDVLAKRPVPKSIGMGSYAMDSHNTQRFVTDEGLVQNEGDIGVRPDAPYSISYGAITPKKAQCANLLVPVCVSSSHIAFGSIRMEPVFMILGESAATAAHLAIENNRDVQDVDYDLLSAKLLQAGQVLEYNRN
ncbi:MAG: FAD-dependent oxidoreductase [Saprospiraceae bacterium]|nr:FAD-dependent oxidoreductase [Saprospiraceae bacterium]